MANQNPQGGSDKFNQKKQDIPRGQGQDSDRSKKEQDMGKPGQPKSDTFPKGGQDRSGLDKGQGQGFQGNKNRSDEDRSKTQPGKPEGVKQDKSHRRDESEDQDLAG